MKQPIPPNALIKTWFDSLHLAPDHEAHILAKKRLIKAFGSIDLASMYAEDNGSVKNNIPLVGKP
jgi:hypothetical protein